MTELLCGYINLSPLFPCHACLGTLAEALAASTAFIDTDGLPYVFEPDTTYICISQAGEVSGAFTTSCQSGGICRIQAEPLAAEDMPYEAIQNWWRKYRRWEKPRTVRTGPDVGNKHFPVEITAPEVLALGEAVTQKLRFAYGPFNYYTPHRNDRLITSDGAILVFGEKQFAYLFDPAAVAAFFATCSAEQPEATT